MSDLVEFLQARFNDEEKLARDLLVDAQSTSLMLQEPKLLGKCIPGWHDWPRVERMCAARLDDVNAKRAIAREHGPSHKHTTVWDWPNIGKWCGECGAEPCRERNSCVICGDDGGCRTLRLLALPYAGQPDHREEWRP